MSLMEQLTNDMKVAMKAKDKETLTVIRMLKAALQKVEIDVKRDLTKEEELTVLARELKQRKESLLEFQKAERDDLIEQVKKEIAIVEGYMPKQLTKEELEQIVKEVIQSVGATQVSDFGKVMKVIVPKVKGQADGAMINQLVKEQLNKNE